MRWPIYQHIFFDCDSTLSTIEGIDILAESANKKWRVEVLTNAAMNGDIDLADVYGKRLQAVRPTRQQIQIIKNSYKKNIVEDAQEVIDILKWLGHKVYIISGGLYEPVLEFGISLGVAPENIRAVDVQYDQLSGDWWLDQDTSSARYKKYTAGNLTATDGKAQVVDQLLGDQSGRSLLIGDGSSDLLASKRVDLFVGYGGVVKRDKVFQQAPVFLHNPSLAPLLALAQGPAGLTQLENSPHATLLNKTVHLIEQGDITFQNEQLKSKFNHAFEAVFARTDRS